MLLWRRLGDETGKPLYTYEADAAGKSSCYADCAKEFPPLVADAHAKASGDFSILTRDDQTKQWVYQGKPLYRYSGKDPVGEPGGRGRLDAEAARATYDPSSKLFAPKTGWRRAAYTPEKATAMPPTVELDGLAIANGFGFVDAATHMTIYAAPVSHKLSSDWEPVPASSLAVPIGEFSIITRKDDSTRQWAYRGAALYTYAGDYAPGEVTGIFTGDKSIQAALAYQNFIPPGVEIGHYPARGPLLTTAKGQTLYYVARFSALYGGRETRTGYAITYNDAKAQGTQGCQTDCTQTWKPVLAAANAQAQGFWEIVTREDGAKQWAFKGSPLYSFTGDKKGGDIAGNNRHVIVYGGSDGEFTYTDAGGGGDIRDPQPLLGKLDMRFAASGAPDTEAVAPVAGAGAANGGGGRRGARGGGAAGGQGAAAAGQGAAAGGTVSATQAAANAAQGFGAGAGAGLYWHLVNLIY
jgi:predicted lipoprotein with Yx(FWY)xxD motif